MLKKVLSYFLRLKKERIIKHSKYFNAKWYISEYVDVKQSGMSPAKHYLLDGYKEGRNPSERFNTNEYVKAYPQVEQLNINPLLYYETVGKHNGCSVPQNNNYKFRNRSIVGGRNFEALPYYVSDKSQKRLNFVTDTIDASSLLGGVATALIIATKFCSEYGYHLRIITRNTGVNLNNYYNILEMNNIQAVANCNSFSDYDRRSNLKLDITDGDIFMATSWWSAAAIKKTIKDKRFFYVIQEVETFFYPYGVEHYLCSEIMKDKNISFIINSHFLNDYFCKNAPNIVENGCYFEPAFVERLYAKEDNVFDSQAKKKFFFYSRPNNPRNMFAYGVELIDEAIKRGILDTDKWEVYFIGQNTPKITFCNGATPARLGQLTWQEYGKFISTVDLALCLMYTPHPSYPPYDVACSGGVVITNTFENKQKIEECDNILFGDLSIDEFMKTFKSGIELASDTDRRQKNYAASTICRDWEITLTDTIKWMGEKI